MFKINDQWVAYISRNKIRLREVKLNVHSSLSKASDIPCEVNLTNPLISAYYLDVESVLVYIFEVAHRVDILREANNYLA